MLSQTDTDSSSLLPILQAYEGQLQRNAYKLHTRGPEYNSWTKQLLHSSRPLSFFNHNTLSKAVVSGFIEHFGIRKETAVRRQNKGWIIKRWVENDWHVINVFEI